jgi:class 3 adenylate cyclase
MQIPGQSLTDKTLLYLFPKSLLETTPWLEIWRERERASFVSLAKIFFPFTALLYFMHYWFFDIPMGLEPSDNWLAFRSTMVGIAILAFFYYTVLPEALVHYRIVAMLVTTAFCVSQAYVTVFYPPAPWLYCYVFVIVSALFLRASVLKSIAFALLVMALQLPALMSTPISVPEVLSAATVTIISIVVLRGGYASDIVNFYLTQSNLEAQRKNIELSIEFADRIKFFIPKKIATRMEQHLASNDASVVSAIYEVLKPRTRNIACLFSDIRGFTDASRKLDSFVKNSAIPNIKLCTETIDDAGGIPRKIGDLLFAYFDEISLTQNVLNALAAAIDIARMNSRLNVHSNHMINRYLLISCGEAVVGNIGGLDSSVEITALGSPVNYLSRLDDATKIPALAAQLKSSDIVLSESAFNQLVEGGIGIQARLIDLHSLGIEVRNFPAEKNVYCLQASEHNCEVVRLALSSLLINASQVYENRSKAA